MWKRTMVTLVASVALVTSGASAADAAWGTNYLEHAKRTWCANHQPYGGWDEANQPGLNVTGRDKWCARHAR